VVLREQLTADDVRIGGERGERVGRRLRVAGRDRRGRVGGARDVE
jgi:hypothetical protein